MDENNNTLPPGSTQDVRDGPGGKDFVKLVNEMIYHERSKDLELIQTLKEAIVFLRADVINKQNTIDGLLKQVDRLTLSVNCNCQRTNSHTATTSEDDGEHCGDNQVYEGDNDITEITDMSHLSGDAVDGGTAENILHVDADEIEDVGVEGSSSDIYDDDDVNGDGVESVEMSSSFRINVGYVKEDTISRSSIGSSYGENSLKRTRSNSDQVFV